MYLILLVLGSVLTVAGIALGATGVSIHERMVDAAAVTPGIVAAVGGLLLIGLGLGLRVLQRIEQSLAASPPPRAALSAEASGTAGAKGPPIDPARIPLPSRVPSATPQPLAVAPPAPASAFAEKPPDDLPDTLSSIARLESARLRDEADFSLSPLAPARPEAEIGETNTQRVSRRNNGAAPARTAPRLDMGALASLHADRLRGPSLDALWPKAQRPMRAAQAAPSPGGASAAIEPERRDEPALDDFVAGAQNDSPASISVLKSGVVDGMAYTLYSDGSIEAQLPQGALRFGSIAELRNHIEQGA
jgi:hypothetical protein